MFDTNRCLSVILHEIKSPLNSILGIVELAKKEGLKNKYFDQIKSLADYMLSLSNNVLDSLKECSKAGEKENFCLREIAEEVANTFHWQKLVKKIDFRFEADEGADCDIFGESLKLKQILINILANAFKFTEDSGRIDFLIKTTYGEKRLQAEFVIRDTGIGMNPEFLKEIFLPFSQEPGNNKYGTGLGLMIVHQLVQQMGGSIDVKSEKGKGSEFTVKLDFEYGKKKQVERTSFPLKRILLVDDSMINLEIVSMVLKDAGAEIDVASNGKLAFDKFVDSEENYYDLILMDMRMPVLSGLEATKAIRALDRSDAKEVKIIGFSSNSLQDDIHEAYACGMDDYVSKPIAVEKLCQVLSQYL